MAWLIDVLADEGERGAGALGCADAFASLEADRADELALLRTGRLTQHDLLAAVDGFLLDGHEGTFLVHFRFRVGL